MKLTEFFELKKPDSDDAMDVMVLNENFDTIDKQINGALSDIKEVEDNFNAEVANRKDENYYPEYTSDEIDESTKFYIDIANMGEGVGIYKRRLRGADNTSWKDLVSGHELNLSSENYQADGIVSNGTPLTIPLDDYLCFNQSGPFTIAFSAKVPATTETNDLITIGGTRKLVIQQRGAYGIRLITFDDTNAMHVYPSEGYITPNSYDEYHHYVITCSTGLGNVRWYQDGVLVSGATSSITNNDSFIKVDGGQKITLFSGENDNVGIQYIKIQNKYLALGPAKRIYTKHSVIDYTNDKTQYDNKFRELDRPAYTEAETRTSLTSGEKLSTALGKIKKWFSDLKTVAFTGNYNDLDNKPTELKNPNELSMTINGETLAYDGSESKSTSFYAPTASGIVGYKLVASYKGAPVWQAPEYGVCTTASNTVAKTVYNVNFKLVTGAGIRVKFSNKHTSTTAATMDVNDTGGRTIVVQIGDQYVNVTNSFSWAANEIVEFVFDGTNWVAISSNMGFVGTNIRRNPKAEDGDIISTHLTVGSRDLIEHVGSNSFTSGNNNAASSSNAAVIGGYCNTASGTYSAVVGSDCSTASGDCSAVVGGSRSTASGSYSVVIGGLECVALANQFKTGHFAKNGGAGDYFGTTGDAFIIGNGSSISSCSNAFRVAYNGNTFGLGAFNSTGADYAEMFEWEDGNPNNDDRRGLFAYIVGDKIRLATVDDTDRRRLGIISARPAVVGDNYDDDWHGKYLTDEFGAVRTQIVHHEAEYQDIEIVDHETSETKIETICIREECDAEEPILNPDYDPEQEYIQRSERPEYDFWSFIGKLVVIDDGTCEEGGYCYPSVNGIATACDNADKGFYVMKRLDDTHIKVLVK